MIDHHHHIIHIPVVTISVPMQKAIADPWMAIAKKSFHTPESDSSRPETQQIIKDIGNPLRIEKNTITKEQENELLSETNTIDPTEIAQTRISGYKEEEEKMLKKIIADLSIVFWVKEQNEISRILMKMVSLNDF